MEKALFIEVFLFLNKLFIEVTDRESDVSVPQCNYHSNIVPYHHKDRHREKA